MKDGDEMRISRRRGAAPQIGDLRSPRVLVAVGGNAIASADGGVDAESQNRAVAAAAEQIADLVQEGYDVLLTHGNGPQVGNLLLKNHLARHVVPAVPLDWCVAQTQATIAYMLVTSLEAALARRGVERLVVPVLTRVLVDRDDPAWEQPSKPIGGYVDEADARDRIAAGEHWKEDGERGWRRCVPSPAPREILDVAAILQLVRDGAVVIAGGGGGIPMVREGDGGLLGVEAVLDKDRTGALLALATGADQFVIATDVEAAALNYGTPQQEWLHQVERERLRALLSEDHFASGSMGPKVEAALTFVDDGGRRAVITSLDHVVAAVKGTAGTVVCR
jgi:carbamate kinase